MPTIQELVTAITKRAKGRYEVHFPDVDEMVSPSIDIGMTVIQLRRINRENAGWRTVNRPGFPGECFICELRLPDHRFRWKHNKLFLLLPEEYGPAFPAIVDCYTSPPT